MKKMNATPWMILVIMATLALSAASVFAVDSQEKTEIKFKNGTIRSGVLRQIQPGLYLLQTDEDLLELTADEIELVGGQPGIPKPGNERPLTTSMQRAQLKADGTVEMWSEEEITNTHDQILTYAMFGAKEHELSFMRTMQAYDQFGNRLNVRIEPRAGTEIYNVFIDFVVPILPGETMRGSLRYTFPDRITCEGTKCRNAFWGNFSEDRLYTRRVELPVGAKLLKADPEPNLQFEHLGQTVVVWRRYYPAQTEFPLVVEYELEK